MAKCPKCGADMVNDGDNLKCPNCNSTQIKESANAGQAKNGDEQQSELDLLKARLAELEKKQEKVAKQSESSAKIKEKLAPVAVFFKKWGLKAVLPAALFLIAFITLLVCFCGLRGIYVNVNNPNEFYSFSPTSYEYHGNLLGEEYVDEGTWTTSGGELKLTYRDEMFGKITDSYSFSHMGYDTVYITDSLGAKKQFKRVSILAYSTPQNIKVAVSLNGGTGIGIGEGEDKLSIGSKIKEPLGAERYGYQFMGWYTTPDGWETEGASQFNFNSRIWEDTTIYANWKDLTEYKLTGDMLPEEGVTFLEGDDLTQIYQSAGGVNEKIGNGSAVIEFKDKNGKIVSGAAPRSNVKATLKEVVIGNNVSSIPDNAFKGCTSLKSVTIPDSVTSIGDRAFYYCNSLTSVTIGDGVTSIGDYAFYYCNSLTSVTIGDGVTSIGDYAFYNCTSLKSVNIPYSVMNIGNKAFYNSKNTTTIYIGLPSTPSGWNSSWYGSGIKIVYDKTVTSSSNNNFNYYVLNDSIYITEYIGSETVVEIPGYIDGKKVLGLDAIFESNTTVTSVTIPDGVANIPYRMFYKCTSLTSVTIPDSVTSIGSSAFYDCPSLTSVTISDGVTSIGDDAFYGCAYLTIYCEAASKPSGWDNNWNVSGCPVVWDANNSDVADDGNIYYIDENGLRYALNGTTARVVRQARNLSGNIEIPASVSYKGITYSVTSIGDRAFEDCTSLTSVTIPDSVTSIGSNAFDGCTAEINWGNNPTIKTIGSYAFSGYRGTSITIPDSVTSIGDYAFSNCTGLTEINWNAVSVKDFTSSSDVFYNAGKEENGITVTFGDNVQKIPAYAFYVYNGSIYSNNIKRVIIGNSVKSIGSSAFNGCTGLTEINWNAVSVNDFTERSDVFYNAGKEENGITVTFGDNVQKIPAYAFYVDSSSYYPNIKLVIIGNSVTIIGDYAFKYCTSLSSVTIGNGVTSIGEDAFYKCTSLTSVTIPDSVTSIGDSAFYKCTSLTSVTIPDSVTSIGIWAFSRCTSLTSVTIPDSVTSIGTWAFLGCESLETITVDSGNSVYHSAGNCLIETATKTLIAGCKNSVIPDDGSVTSIGHDAFWNCTSLTSVTIPDSVTSIGSHAFEDCTSLTSVIIGDSVTSIGGSAFEDCTSLTSVTIPDSVTSIESYAFDGCTAEINWGNNPTIETISSYAFSGYKGTSITIPNSVTSIGDKAFYNCTWLTSVTIPDGVTSIGEEAFRDCSSLTIYCEAISKPSGWDNNWNYSDCPVVWDANNSDVADDGYIYYIDENGLRYALKDTNATVVRQSENLRGNIEISASVRYKGITYSVTSIGDWAFCGCTSLSSVTIGDSVTSIGSSAFSACDSLTSVTIPDSVTRIESYSFAYCESLTSVTFEGTVAQWRAISKGTGWDSGTPFTEVVCSNGTVSV